jgi:membrane protease YdiL (CAAX protease family)
MDDTAHLMPALASLGAVVLGVSLGLVGVGYQQLLHYLPWTEVHDALKQASDFFKDSPNARIAYAIMAIGIAPWVEEFLFRGLMFRAMVPQWGMPLAIVSSTAFFTILHPALSWPMVFCLGAVSAYLFYRVRSLLPCVLLHFSYNATILGLTPT